MNNLRVVQIRLLQALAFALAIVAVSSSAQTSDRYQIGAYYFGTYSPTYNHRLAQTAMHYPGYPTPWWGGIMQYSLIPAGGSIDGWTARSPVPTPLSGFEFTEIKPALGWYNQDIGDTLYYQINQARAHGLSYFNFYWYYKPSTTGGIINETINAALHHTDDTSTSTPAGSFLAANDYIRNSEHKAGMKFMITIYGNGEVPDASGNLTLTRNGIVAGEYVRRWINYMKRPDYLRTRTNRPIIAFGQNVAGDPTLVRDTISLLNQTWTNQGLGPLPYVVMENDEIGQAASVVSGSTCLNDAYQAAPTPYSNVWSYARYKTNHRTKLNSWPRAPGGGSIPCAMTDFNEKPRTRVEYLGTPYPTSNDLATARGKVRYLSDWSEITFDGVFSDLKAYLDSNYKANNPVAGYATIYSWNEWSESVMNIEPSCQNNHWVLDKIQTRFGLNSDPGATHYFCTNCVQ